MENKVISMEFFISGGYKVSPNQYPWMVRTQIGCGGSLISDRHVLTAYHCVPEGSAMEEGFKDWVKVSVHNQEDSEDYEKVSVEKIVYPPDPYMKNEGEEGKHDIAIIILARSVRLFLFLVCTISLDRLGRLDLFFRSGSF